MSDCPNCPDGTMRGDFDECPTCCCLSIYYESCDICGYNNFEDCECYEGYLRGDEYD